MGCCSRICAHLGRRNAISVTGWRVAATAGEQGKPEHWGSREPSCSSAGALLANELQDDHPMFAGGPACWPGRIGMERRSETDRTASHPYTIV